MSKGFGYFVYILFSCACGLLILYSIIDSGMLKLYLPWMGFTFILGVCLCIIGALMNVIHSCERQNKYFTIKVDSYRVVDDYDEINDILSIINAMLYNNCISTIK